MASFEEQRQLWLGHRKGEMSSFEETVCGIFDDSGLARAMDKGLLREKYGDEIAQQVEILRRLIHKIPSNLRPSDLIELPIMHQIRESAKSLLETPLFNDEEGYNEVLEA